MKKICSLLLTYFLVITSAFAQTGSGKISGKVQADNNAVGAATVIILRLADSAQVSAQVCDKAGRFEFDKLSNATYLVKVTAVGHAPYFSKPVSITDQSNRVVVPVIELVKTNKDLGAVKVTTTRPVIENKIDKLVVNVEAAISNAGSTALDVLERSPGITLDKDGNITLKGKQGVIVLIDGKQTYLSAADLATLLKNTPANQLDQIEIMSQPSAKYDASGNSGMINIRTKKNQQAGYNGSISLSYVQGKYPRSNNSFVFNKRKGKVNLFTTISTSYNRNFYDIAFVRNITDKSTSAATSIFDQSSYNWRRDQPNSIKVGVDFFATKKTTLGAVASFTYLNAGGGGESSTNIYNGAHVLSSKNAAVTDFTYQWHNYSANLNFRHLIDTAGKELSADLDYILYHKTNPGTTDNFAYDIYDRLVGYPFLLRISTPSDIAIYTAKIDYVHPVNKVTKIEAGAKSSYVSTDNVADYTYYDNATNTWKIDSRTNHFKYNENINAAYLNASKQAKKWGYQLGLRVENTVAEGKQITNNQNFTKNYTQLFPTVYISYTANKKNTFGLSYGKRIDRPSYQDMNPFRYFLDKFTYREGNPNLTPQFTQNIELSHNYKGQLNTSINYTRTTDIITDIFIQNDLDSSIAYKRQNIATRRNIGLSVNYNVALSKIWNFTFSTNVFNNYFSGVINSAQLNVDYTSFTINTSNQFKFKKGWSAEISGLYRYRSLDGSSLDEPLGMIVLGAAKQILKNKGTLKLNVRDPFYTMQYKSITKFDNIDMNTIFRSDSRQVAFAFTYRFGKNQNNIPQRKRTSASQDEQNRVGQGGGNQ
jgi:hypothetical protein